MEHQDWDKVVLRKSNNQNKSKTSNGTRAFNPAGTKKFRSLDGEDPPPPEKISHNIRNNIQKARCAKNMSQKDLAKKLNMSLSVINDYERGKAIPDRSTLSRLGRALGVKLN
jgi:putative transcription factor